MQANKPLTEWTVSLLFIFVEVVFASNQQDALEKAINVTASKFKSHQSESVFKALRNLSTIRVIPGNHPEIIDLLGIHFSYIA